MPSKSKLAGALNLLPASALESEKTIICVRANEGKNEEKCREGHRTNFQLTLRRMIRSSGIWNRRSRVKALFIFVAIYQ